MKCVKCYREIDEHLKFCTYCGAKQPVDRAAYEQEHPELAEALSDDELLEQQRQRQVMEAERKAREEVERIVKEEVERKLREEAERKAKRDAERKAKEEAERNLIACPNCGQEVSSDVNFCPNCAHPIASQNYINDPLLHEEESTLPLPQDEQEYYFYCPTCGAVVREGDSSCISCGQVFDWSDTSLEQQSTLYQAYITKSSENNVVIVIVLAILACSLIALILCG